MNLENIRRAAGTLAIGAAITVFAACAPTPTPASPPAVPTTAPVPTTASVAPVAPVATAVTLQLVKNDTLGNLLTDGDGNTLYLFTKDTKGTSNCYDKCATAWPPVIPAGDATVKEGVAQALLGTTKRTDGSTQLTYNGWPLYYYDKDTKPGDTVGQAVGKVWWVVSGEGNIISPAALTLAKDDKLGSFLSDDKGMSLYMYTKDTKDTSVCYDKCEVAWPPLLTVGAPTLGAGVDASKLGTTLRKDGSTQVTYNGLPLYYYDKDKAPGDVVGQGVGKVWWVLGADGTPNQATIN